MDTRVLCNLLSEYVKGVIILDKNGDILCHNNRCKELCNDDKIIGKNFNTIFPVKLDEIMNKDIIMKSISGKKYEVKHKKIIEECIEYILVFVNEITDFNDNDIKLYCLQNIIESISDGVIVSDYEGRIVLYNNSHEKLEGLNSKEVIGKYLWEAYNSSPQLSEHQKVYKSKIPIINKYRAHAYKDGIPKYVSYSTYPIIKNNETIAVYSISKNENGLQSLLYETLELKRKLYSKSKIIDESLNNGTRYTFSDIISENEEMKTLIRESETMAILNTPILIVGETGTGKEMFAQSIHNLRSNKDDPFVDINCSAIPENLLEGILFGTVKGSYTGAMDQAGLFEEARNGTLFLDEINSMPVSMQSKLLRVLQEKKVRRIGGINSIPITCRIISAVNEEPQKIMSEGKLRQDLYYRIAGISLYIPPLRERREDIIHTANFFINRYNDLFNKNIKKISDELMEVMISYKWPGNVRELEHVIENIMIRAKESEEELRLMNMPQHLKENILGNISKEILYKEKSSLSDTLRNIEKKLILESLSKNDWNFSKTARDLGIIRQSLEYRMKKLNIENKKD